MTSEQIRQALGLKPWNEHARWVRTALPGIDPRRRSGRTTRIICDGLARVSEGTPVRFVAATKAALDGMMTMAWAAAARMGLDPALIEGVLFSEQERQARGRDPMPEDFEDHFRLPRRGAER